MWSGSAPSGPLLEEQFATRGAQLFVERLGQIINLSKDGQIEIADLIQAYLKKPSGTRSAANSNSQPPEPLTVFLDESLDATVIVEA